MEGQLLPRVDADVAKELEKSFRKQGIRVLTGAKATGVDPAGRTVSVSVGGKAETLSAEAVLVAVGRKMLTDGLGLEACGVRINRGIVEVDDGLRTACASIYAIGDIVGGMMLAHEASAMGVAAAERMAGKDARRPEGTRIPACVFCQPEVAVVGLTEEEARSKGHDVKVSKFPVTALGKAAAAGHTEGFVKMVADGAYGEILGCHIIGHGAPDMIAELGVAMSLEATWGELGKAVHAHPTLPEAVKEAALMIGGEETDI